uniref:DUF834 domain-containing protein n=1 Tax=Oryza meridionalis TaxID=40149 RepID=A0A0E0CK22_9ORYZ
MTLAWRRRTEEGDGDERVDDEGMAPTIFGLDEEAEDDGLGAADLTMKTDGTLSWRERRPDEGDDDGATFLGSSLEEKVQLRKRMTRCSRQQQRHSEVFSELRAWGKGCRGRARPSAAIARAGSARLDGEGLPKVDDDDVLDVGVHGAPAGLGRNRDEAGEEEAAAKRIVATRGSEEVPTAGEGRPELHDGSGARRRRRGSQGKRRRRAAVCREREEGVGTPFIGREGGGDRPRRGEKWPENSPGCHQWQQFIAE